MFTRILSVALAAILAASAVQAQVPQQLRLSQARQYSADEVRLRAYVDLTDADGKVSRRFDQAALSGTLGERELVVEDIGLFRDSLEGIAYIFLLDVSRSLQASQFGVLRQAVDQWISALGPDDQVAVVAFGETSRLVADFTQDLDSVRTAVANLEPTADLTALYRALLDTASLAQRRDPGLPNRRVAIVVSDGRDEGSGVVFEDALKRLEDVQIPVYAIGSSRLPEPARRRHLDELKRLALRTGGDIREVDGGNLSAACRQVDQLIRRVWALGLYCPRCIADGNAYRLQLNLQVGARVLSDGKSVRSLPSLAAEQSPTQVTVPVATAADRAAMGGPALQDVKPSRRERGAALLAESSPAAVPVRPAASAPSPLLIGAGVLAVIAVLALAGLQQRWNMNQSRASRSQPPVGTPPRSIADGALRPPEPVGRSLDDYAAGEVIHNLHVPGPLQPPGLAPSRPAASSTSRIAPLPNVASRSVSAPTPTLSSSLGPAPLPVEMPSPDRQPQAINLPGMAPGMDFPDRLPERLPERVDSETAPMARPALTPDEAPALRPGLVATLGGLAALTPSEQPFTIDSLENSYRRDAGRTGEHAVAPLGRVSQDQEVVAVRATERPGRETRRSNAVPPRRLLLVVVRGVEAGREYALGLRDNAVVGSHQDCDCVLEEGTLAAQRQFELSNVESGIMCRNLSQRDPTLLNGFPIQGSMRVDSGDLIGNGRVIFRVVLV